MSKILIVGAGLTGSVAARLLADDGWNVTVFESKDKVAGQLHDSIDENDVLFHHYGPHIFHTDNQETLHFMERFTEFVPFQLKYISHMTDGVSREMPPNLKTFADLGVSSDKIDLLEQNGVEQTKKEKNNFPMVAIGDLVQSNSKEISEAANKLLMHNYIPYSEKQWGIPFEEVSLSTVNRVGVIPSFKRYYFKNGQSVGLPRNGYTEMIWSILDHENIDLKLNRKVNSDELGDLLDYYDFVIWTGILDEGLPYRSLEFIDKTKEFGYDISNYGYSIEAFPAREYLWTRITHYKTLNPIPSENDKAIAEIPCKWIAGINDPYYPISSEDNDRRSVEAQEKILRKYNERVIPLGRLAEYKYYDMDKAVERVLSWYEEFKQGDKRCD